MQFFNVKRGAKSTITYTFAELKKLEETEHSCVEKVTQRLHLTLLPFHLSNISSSISEILSSNVTKYNKDLGGILLGYKNVKILDSTPAIHNDNCLVHVTVDADFYLFKPFEGKTLIGFVNQISDDHIGCLVHKAFNIVIPKEQDGSSVKKNQHILVKVSYTNLEAKLPYIKADLISVVSDTDSGISTCEENHHDTSISQNTQGEFIKKNKSPKKAKYDVYEGEDEATSGIYLGNDKIIDESTKKKKKSKKQKHQHTDDQIVNYQQSLNVTEHDSSHRTLESYLNEYLKQKDVELPSQKKKKKKKLRPTEYENSEEVLNEIDNNNDETNPTSSIKKEKKRSKKKIEENQCTVSGDSELLAFIPKIKPKKQKKNKLSKDEPNDNVSIKLETGEKDQFQLDKEDSGETEQVGQEILNHKFPNFKILQNITICKPKQELKLKESSLEKLSKIKNKRDTLRNDFEDPSEDIRYPKKKKKHKDVKKGNLDVVDGENLKEELFKHTENDLSFGESLIKDVKCRTLKNDLDDENLNKIKKPKKTKKYSSDEVINPTIGDLDKSEDNSMLDLIRDLKTKALKDTLEDANNSKSKKTKKNKKAKQTEEVEAKDNTFNLMEDLKRKAFENVIDDEKDLNKIKKHKKTKKHNSNEVIGDVDKSEDNSTVDLIRDLKRKSLQGTLEDTINVVSKKAKKHKNSKQVEDDPIDSTSNLLEDLKRKALENALVASEDSHKKSEGVTFELMNASKLNKKSKQKKSKETENENLQKANNSTDALIEDLKRKAIESISKDSSSKEVLNTNINSKNKKARKVKKHDKDNMFSTEHMNLNENEIDNIRHSALAQALSKITDPPETKSPKKKKKKHNDELDIGELRSQALQKILGNLNDDEISSHSKRKKKKKEKNEIDNDKMKQMAMENVNNDEDDSSREELEPFKQNEKVIKRREKSLEKLGFEHSFGDDQSKHKVKRKKRKKD